VKRQQRKRMDGMKYIDVGWNLENSYAKLPERFFAVQNPTPVSSPQLVILNKSLAESLGLDINGLQKRVEIFAGNALPEGSVPIAQAYAGHQFGYFTMLGDGRTLLLGELIAPDGRRFDIQLKGSGRTPYSRGGDGRAALGPMLREYIISKAMHGLNIPTTRSLAVVTTGEKVIRERPLPGAILTRVAASHIRVGTFQYIAAYGNVEELQILAEYTLQRHYPSIALEKTSKENRFLLLLRKVIKKQAELIAKWQLVGFIHGVMNTDNMAISGETIDYGPCAFMDAYSPETVFSSIDMHGRYAYGNQPGIAAWNLARFAETLLPLLHNDREKAVNLANEEVSKFAKLYSQFWLKGMRAKLGLFYEESGDESLIKELLTVMEKHKADYTNTFRRLTLSAAGGVSEKPGGANGKAGVVSEKPGGANGKAGGVIDKSDTVEDRADRMDEKSEGMNFFCTPEFLGWKEKWKKRVARENKPEEEFKRLMKMNNPAVIPRNHRVEEALEAAEKDGDYSRTERLLNVLTNPYAYSDEQEEFSVPPPPSAHPYRTFCGT
jgi:uncharacterized protein YdiU (UPF0061 family)